MPPGKWPLHNDRPSIQVVLTLPGGGQNRVRRLVADTGAGTRKSVFQILLTEDDCLQSGGFLMGHVQLSGAYRGWFPLYLVDIGIPELDFKEPVPAIGLTQVPPGFEGIAGFKFLNMFRYGNLGDPNYFSLDLFR